MLFLVFLQMVGLGGLEPPTSSLSGMRSSQLSYRPSSLLPTWWSWSGSNRRPPECKSGALPAELQPLKSITSVSGSLFCRVLPPHIQSRPVGYRNHQSSRWPFGKSRFTLSGDPMRGSPDNCLPGGLEWNGCLLLAHAVHSGVIGFPKLHPRSLLERR